MAIIKYGLALFIFFLSCLARAETAVFTSFIAITPAQFSKSFNAIADISNVSLRLPVWKNRNGTFKSTLASGVSITAQGVLGGDGISSISLHCQKSKKCSDATALVALTVDPNRDPAALNNFLRDRFDGKLSEDDILEEAGLWYALKFNRKQQSLTLTITAEQDDEDS